ncbi:MAG: EAL domain-containing protein [bacterium]|nr:EAL domain-containing protein [bacterium]
MNMIIHYDVAALVIALIVLLHYSVKRTLSTNLTKIFLSLLAASLVSCVLDIVTMFTISYPAMIPLWLNYALNIVYLILFNSTSVIYYVYVLAATKKEKQWNGIDFLTVCVPFLLEIALIVSTPVSGWVFSFTPQLEYVHGFGMGLLYACAFYYVVAALVRTILYRKYLTSAQRMIVLFYTLGCLVAIYLQLIVDGLQIIQFGVAIAVLLIYMSLENPEDYSEIKLGTLNRYAFREYVAERIRMGKDFELMGIQIGGMEYLQGVVGAQNADGIRRSVAESIQSVASKKRKVFYIGGNRMVIFSEKVNDVWDMLGQVIKRRFSKAFVFQETEFMLDISLCIIPNEEHKTLTQADDIVRMVENALREAVENGGREIVIADETILEKGRREDEILRLLKRAIRNNLFEVFYQPIYSVKQKRYTSAEALVRLKDQSMGYISPEEFIPIAEQYGLIQEIGLYVFREVCKLIASHNMWERGIECIDVNLSPMQCMHEELHEKLISIMDEYHLPYHVINLEITETAAILSTEALHHNMTQLMAKGVHFSLDDYGTGFSNTADIIDYPFHIIKLDKSMLWSSEESEKAKCALEHMIAMIKAMHMGIVCEGVETLEQAQMLEQMGCDYFQGYYYSQPVCADDFIDILSRDRAYALLEE